MITPDTINEYYPTKEVLNPLLTYRVDEYKNRINFFINLAGNKNFLNKVNDMQYVELLVYLIKSLKDWLKTFNSSWLEVCYNERMARLDFDLERYVIFNSNLCVIRGKF